MSNKPNETTTVETRSVEAPKSSNTVRNSLIAGVGLTTLLSVLACIGGKEAIQNGSFSEIAGKIVSESNTKPSEKHPCSSIAPEFQAVCLQQHYAKDSSDNILYVGKEAKYESVAPTTSKINQVILGEAKFESNNTELLKEVNSIKAQIEVINSKEVKSKEDLVKLKSLIEDLKSKTDKNHKRSRRNSRKLSNKTQLDPASFTISGTFNGNGTYN